ncbi:MAG: DEAD/DEAH box helicase [Cyclobacteriaceae bacterium]|nr:DEAD/DEAH box helicase [Cyclobacteriaceae bacterium HetDA_MAG_MS6]
MKSFADLGLSTPILEALSSIGIVEPTDIQQQAIPLLTSGKMDFIGLAQTGTGKTAAFGLPLIENIDPATLMPQALVLAPTRELGQQIAQQLEAFSKKLFDLKVLAVYGGAPIGPQIKALKRPVHIVIATPGRLLDLINRKAVTLKEVQYVVLDEADEMLNMGFKEDLRQILSTTPNEKNTWLFSATMPPEIRQIIKDYMTDPTEVSVNASIKVNTNIEHQFVVTKTADKLAALKRFLDIQPEMRGIMFCRTKIETQKIAEQLGKEGYSADALHGDLSQQQRDKVMKRFKSHNIQLLVATDVAARGIDVNDLTHVIHHTLPDQIENYTHRSGRTARAGKKGISLAFINGRESRKIKLIENKSNLKFKKIEVPQMNQIQSIRLEKWAGSILGNQGSIELGTDLATPIIALFEDMTKDQLLQKLMSMELAKITQDSHGDLNESTSAERSKKGKRTTTSRSRSEAPTDPGKDEVRYFINLGTKDGITKGDLVHFLSDQSGVKRKHFGKITLQKMNAFFTVKKQHSSGLESRFKGMEVNGRALRVNKD